MNLLHGCAGFAVGDITVPRLIAQESAAMIVLTTSLLVFRTFRERYFLIWILGWIAYLGSGWTLHGSDSPSRYAALSHTEFIIAVCLFAAALLVYTHARRLLLPLLLLGLGLTGLAVARALWWPDSAVLHVVLEV